MSWLSVNLNESLSSLKGQLSNFTRGFAWGSVAWSHKHHGRRWRRMCYRTRIEIFLIYGLEECYWTISTTKHVQLYISDSRKLQAMLTRTPKVAKEAPSELVYYNLTYSCIHGGRKFKSRGKGVRPNQQTFRQECCAKIFVKLDETYKYLKVTSLILWDTGDFRSSNGRPLGLLGLRLPYL